MFPGDHQAAAVFRAMITAKTLLINPKNIAAYSIANTMHIIMTTNAKWAIPAGADARRFLMLDVVIQMNRAYFNDLWREATTGGIEAMLHDLLRLDLTKFHPRDVPATDALREQQRRSADSIADWITDCVTVGEIVPPSLTGGGSFGFNQQLPFKTLYDAYLTFCKDRGKRPESAKALGTAFKKMGLVRSASNNPAQWTIPSAAALQSACDKWSGIR